VTHGGPWAPRLGTAPTKRELEVLAWSLYLGQKGAAARLGISTKTVKETTAHIFIRLGVNRSIEAAMVLGWLQIPDEVWFDDTAYPKRWSRAIVTRSCRSCGEVFFPRRATVEDGGGLYCSVSCSRRGKPPSHGGRVTYRCAFCRQEFTVPGSRARAGQRFCSRKCARRARDVGSAPRTGPALPTVVRRVDSEPEPASATTRTVT